MKRCTILAILLTCLNTGLFAQNEETAIKQTVNNLFIGMKAGDSTIARSAFAGNCIMQTIVSNYGIASARTENLNEFIKFIGSVAKDKLDERIVFTKILIDGPLAVVWTDYKFYLNNKFSHCGVNSFQLVKGAKGWRIVYLIDTRRKNGCKE